MRLKAIPIGEAHYPIGRRLLASGDNVKSSFRSAQPSLASSSAN
jgi:hypothetical protein